MIKLSNVNKSFEDKVVLKDFSLHVSAGERICLMGASGTGKTTILRLVMGLENADDGEVYKGGAVSAVFQEDRLCEDFSALSNVALVCDDKEKAKEMLCALSLCDDLDTPVRDLSGGMKRRVSIARALCFPHEILLLDEAFSGLDEQTKGVVAEVINRESTGKTLILVSHDETEAKLINAKIINI